MVSTFQLTRSTELLPDAPENTEKTHKQNKIELFYIINTLFPGRNLNFSVYFSVFSVPSVVENAWLYFTISEDS
jgi:hypothetical protein